MNKIFKVIWSKSRNCYVVASELAKGHTKASSTGDKTRRLALAAITALMLLPVGGFSYAADTTTVEPAATGSTKTVEVYTKEGTDKQIDAANKYTYRKTAELDQKLTDQKTSTALHVTQAGNLIIGTKENQTVKDMKIRGKLTSGSLSTGDITSTGDVTVTGKVAADGVTDETTKDGTYIKQNNTVGNNLVSLDKQVKANDDRITAVKEYLQKEAADTYVNKNDAAVQDGAVVKAANTIGDNVTKLDAALAKETAARLGADAAQDKVIQQVNENASQGIATLATAYQNEAAAREAKDNELNERITNEANEIHKTTNQLQTDLNKETADRKTADNELNERITNEANAIHETTKQLQTDLNTETTARETADAALDTRITNVKEYLEKQTSDTYVSKADAAVQDGAIVKADKTIGENVTNLDAALAKETAARIGADAAQDKVIQQVNQNMVDGFNTINKNMADGFTALNQADAKEAQERAAADAALDDKITAETSARVAADTKLVEAVNSGLSLSNDNVLQKNTTTIDAQGNVTTSKTDANEMILNKGKDNQITLNEKGIKVGTNSSVIDKDGVYTGGDDYTAAKAALKSDGSIKGADGKFTVDGTNGNVNTNGSLTAASGKIGNVSMSADGTMTGVKDLTASGKITADSFTDGTATMSNGSLNGVNQINATGNIVTTGNMKAHDITAEGTIKGETINGTTGTFGSLSTTGNASVGGTLTTNGITNTGNTTTDTLAVNHNATVGGNLSVTGDITGKSLNVGTGSISGGQITGTGLDVGAGTIKTTGATETGTLKTTGKAEIGGDLSVAGNTEMKGNLDVKGDLSVEGEFNAKTLSSKLDENNYTTINGGNVTSVNSKLNKETGEIQASASTFNETGSNMLAKDDDSIGKSTVTADGISQKLSDTGDNPKAYAESTMSQGTNNKYTMTDTVKDGDKTNVASQSATESSNVITDENKNTSTFRQKVDSILQEINNADNTKSSSVEQKLDSINSKVTDGTNTTSVEQGTQNITNTATNGTISNIADKVMNQGTTSVTSQIGDGSAVKSEMTAAGITNTAVGGTITNSAKDLVNTATGDMTNTVGGKMLNNVTGDMENKVGGNLTTTVGGKETHTVGGTLTETVTGDVTKDYKANLSTTVGGSQTTTVTGDSSLIAENITNEAKNKITNKAIDVETDATSSIVNKVSNDAGSNTSTQLSYQTKEEMSQSDGKTASYLRGAAEEKSQLTDGDKKTTIDTIAGQTNTNITEGTNTSNSLQKADQIASSVTDGTNTTVVNQDATSLASSITDGTKANNTNNTVDKSEQLIKASDTQYSATTKTASKTEDALVNGSTLIDIVKDSTTGTVSSAVTDGTNTTGITQTAKDITNTAKNGTIANDAKDITNNVAENMTNTVGKNLTTTVGGNQTTTVTGDSSLSANNISNTATTSITNKVGDNVSTTMSTDSIVNKVGKTTITTTDGKTKLTNEDGTHVTEMDYADVMKDLGVRGNATVDGDTTLGKEEANTKLTVNSKSTFKDTVKLEKTLEVDGTSTFNNKVTVTKGGLDVNGGTTTDTLHVTSTSTFDGKATFKNAVTMEKDLSVGGNATVAGSMTASSYKVGNNTYIDSNGINANNQKIVNVAAGDLSASSTDAVNGAQLYQTNERVASVENRVDTVENRVNNLDSRVDKVGANAAALANLHPLEFDADSKWNIAAAVGGYKGETATAIGAFYRPNENVMINVSSSFGTGENMYGGGISLRIGQGGNKARRNATNGLTDREKAMQKQIDSLTNRLDALLSVINPNMSKDFPDVPENHWAYEAVSRLAGNGVIQGYEDGKYHGDRTMTRYEMAEIIYNALSKGAKAEKKLVEEFKPELQAMAAQKKA